MQKKFTKIFDEINWWYMNVAHIVRLKSKDKDKDLDHTDENKRHFRKVGAVIRRDKIENGYYKTEVVGIGWNGMKMKGENDRHYTWDKPSYNNSLTPFQHRKLGKNDLVLHAEQNAIIFRNERSLEGAFIYSTLYPCYGQCSPLILECAMKGAFYSHTSKNYTRNQILGDNFCQKCICPYMTIQNKSGGAEISTPYPIDENSIKISHNIKNEPFNQKKKSEESIFIDFFKEKKNRNKYKHKKNEKEDTKFKEREKEVKLKLKNYFAQNYPDCTTDEVPNLLVKNRTKDSILGKHQRTSFERNDSSPHQKRLKR